MRWSPDEIQSLERAIESGSRVRLMRKGNEHTVIPIELHAEGSRERLTARLTSSGESLQFFLDEIEGFDAFGR